MYAENSGSSKALQRERVTASWLLGLVLLITTVGSLLLSHVRMMWSDELLSYWGDRMPTAADVIHVQLNYPISLDPPTYHLLAHWSMKVFGQGAMGMRMPALLGVVLAQLALFFFVRRISGPRTAVLAAALPAALGPFWYSAEGRPYGWMLGMYGLAMLCWQGAVYGDKDADVARRSSSDQRLVPLVGLVLAIAGAITSHYFGVLILLPFAVAELVRTAGRRFDWPVIAAIAVGASSIVLILPFQKALKVYQQHYYSRHVTLEAIKLGYTNVVSQSVIFTCLFVLVTGVEGYRRYKRRDRDEGASTWALLFVLALMPVWCFLFELFVTHSMEGRYAIPAVLAFVAILAIALEHRLNNKPVYYAALGVVLLASVGSIAVKIRREQKFRAEFMSQLTSSDAAKNKGADVTSKPIYVNSFGDFLPDQYYAPPSLQSRLTYVYDADKEIQWKGRDTHSISAVNVRNFAPELRVAPYGEFLQQDKPLMLVYGVDDWEWLPSDLEEKHLPTTSLGKLMLGELEQVDTHPSGIGDRKRAQ